MEEERFIPLGSRKENEQVPFVPSELTINLTDRRVYVNVCNELKGCWSSVFLPGRTSSQADCIVCPVGFSATQVYSPASSVVTLCRCSVYTFDALLCSGCTRELI